MIFRCREMTRDEMQVGHFHLAGLQNFGIRRVREVLGVGGGYWDLVLPQNVTKFQVNNEQWGRVHLDSAAPSRFLWATTWRRTLPKAQPRSWLTSSEKSWGRSRRTWWRATKAWSLRTWSCCPAAWRTASPSRSCFSPLLLLCYRAF